MSSRQNNDLFKVTIPEIFREIRNLRGLVNSVLNGAVTTGASAVVTFAANATLKFLDQSYLVFNDGTADQIRIGRLADSSIGLAIGSITRLQAAGSSTFGGGVGISTLGAFSPSNFGTAQTGAMWMGTGVPSNTNGNNGDFFFRTDTPGTANQRLYVRSAGAWVGVL